MSVINGTGGPDNLLGTADNDVLSGGAGNDTIDGAGGIDSVDYLSATAGVQVNLTAGTAQDGLGGNDILRNIEQIGGSDFNDILIGDAGSNFILGRVGDDSIDGGAGDDRLAGGPGTDTLIGGAGNDVLMPGPGPGPGQPQEQLVGGDGFDAADYSDLDVGIAADLYSGTYKDHFDSIENLIGSNFNDFLSGDYTDNVLIGNAGDDVLEGREGSDNLDGGAGSDTAVYSGNFADYTIAANGAGAWIVTDNRAGKDGVDHIQNIETLRFADRSVAPGASGGGGGSVDPTIAAAIHNVLRMDGNSSALGSSLSAKVAAGQMTMGAAMAAIVDAADTSTAVATLSYEFFTGKVPSEGGIDFLVSPTGPNANNINSAYYQSFSLENRYINFAVNLGKAGEGRAGFEAAYGGMTLFDTTRSVYTKIFGDTPSDAKLHALLDPSATLGGVSMTRAEYFAYYGGDGPNGIGTKAAMVGWLLAEAVKADLGVYAKVDDAYLTDLTDGASFGIDIVGAYNRPEYVYHPG